VVVVPGLDGHRDQVIGVRFSEGSSERESRLLRGLLSLAAEATSESHLVAAPQLLRLSQARAHLCAGQFFIHEIHLGAPVLVGLHGCG
jgi:hypothetical protein